MTRLVVTGDAEADTNDILAYLAQEAGAGVALEYGRRFRATIERLLDLPQSGAPRPRLGSETRIAIVAPYILIYDYTRDADTMTLLRILHGKRDITRKLLNR
jgi:plasmid stabilization system protein ParE